MTPEATPPSGRVDKPESPGTPVTPGTRGTPEASGRGITPARPALRTARNDAPPYVTRDGSIIRELMHPAVHGNANQSLAEAEVPPGCATLRHTHPRAEELYHVLEGDGEMMLGDAAFPVAPGDTVCIPPGTPHNIRNTGVTSLRVLCCCSPAYSHDDTVLTD